MHVSGVFPGRPRIVLLFSGFLAGVAVGFASPNVRCSNKPLLPAPNDQQLPTSSAFSADHSAMGPFPSPPAKNGSIIIHVVFVSVFADHQDRHRAAPQRKIVRFRHSCSLYFCGIAGVVGRNELTRSKICVGAVCKCW